MTAFRATATLRLAAEWSTSCWRNARSACSGWRLRVEASLKRLGTDYVEVYWAHLPDTITPVDGIAAAFDDPVRAGKILHGGLSTFPAWPPPPPSPSCATRPR
ncbi:aldo/keto reductase [Streptomyces sp. NPDC020794]|uniref:aldo/keto reductase n=1 Tax=unclassified Streptomyces TaxID=2593676 RepID=UPI0036E9D370